MKDLVQESHWQGFGQWLPCDKVRDCEIDKVRVQAPNLPFKLGKQGINSALFETKQLCFSNEYEATGINLTTLLFIINKLSCFSQDVSSKPALNFPKI